MAESQEMSAVQAALEAIEGVCAYYPGDGKRLDEAKRILGELGTRYPKLSQVAIDALEHPSSIAEAVANLERVLEWLCALPIPTHGCTSQCHRLLRSINAIQAARPTWISVKDRLPQHRQNVLFVVDGRDSKQSHLTGSVLGGFYDETCQSFNTPGVGYWASCWQPAPFVAEGDAHA